MSPIPYVALLRLLSALDVGVLIVDEDGTVLEANERYCAIFGLLRGAILGASFDSIHSDALRASAWAFHRSVVASDTVLTRDSLFVRPDGETVNVSTSSVAWTSPEGRRIRGTLVHDTTRLKSALAAAERLASFPQLNPNPIAELDSSFSVIYANDACLRSFPDLRARGAAHPLLAGLESLKALYLAASGDRADPQSDSGDEYAGLQLDDVEIGGRWFQRFVHRVRHPALRLRIYAFDVSGRKRAELALAESEAHLRAVLDTTHQAVTLVEPDGKVRLLNRRAEAMFGAVTGKKLHVGDQVRDLFEGEVREVFDARIAAALAGQDILGTRRFPLHSGDGFMDVEIEYVPVRGAAGDVYAVCFIMSDITQRLLYEERAALMELVFRNTSEGIVLTDADARILRTNEAFLRITGYDEAELKGENPRIFKSGWQSEEFYRKLWRSLLDEGSWRGEIWDRRKDGSLYAQSSAITAIRDEKGAVRNFIAIVNDITDQKRADERIRHLAYYDTLTDLPNRSLFQDRLSHSIETAKREGSKLALLFVDLDRFKSINDGLGHHAGDAFLQAVALRFRGLMRASDTVSRLGGDEFTVIVERLEDVSGAAAVAEKLVAAMAEPVSVDGTEIVSGASVGIAVFPDDGDNAEVLLQNADAAMYRAKDAGRNGFRFYRPDMNERALQRIRAEARLTRAEEEHALSLRFQPQVRIADGSIIGWEALLRWTPEGLDPIPPSIFIPIAEESGLIVAIGDWALRAALDACRKGVLCAEWPRGAAVRTPAADGGTAETPPRGIVRRPVMAVNLSARQFAHPGLLDRIRTLLKDSGLSGESIEFEITESAVMRDVESSITVLRGLKDLGASVAVDDFGTGYSSLSYLKRFPIDRLKIDKSFVQDLPGDAEVGAIVETILALARSLGMRSIAEGVETPEQLAFLSDRGCDEYQGYLFSQPLLFDDAVALIRGRERGRS